MSNQTWGNYLQQYNTENINLFEQAFLDRWSQKSWLVGEEDKVAAAELHIQISSRITVQALGYRDGVEGAALASLYSLFETSREICSRNIGATLFEAVVWHILNTHVRPFTAKWHARYENGALNALDSTDEFRAELVQLQPLLQCFDDLLLDIRDGQRPPLRSVSSKGRISSEFSSAFTSGIPEKLGGLSSDIAKKMNDAEWGHIRSRREHYAIHKNITWSSGLALSGGGIRSATFSLGVLIALGKRNLLPQFDFLSTVSGGGYLGGFLTSYLSAELNTPAVGLKKDQLPLRKEAGEASALRHIRHHSRYLQTSLWERAQISCAQLYGMLVNLFAVALIPVLIAIFDYFFHWLLGGVNTNFPRDVVILIFLVAALGMPILARFSTAIANKTDLAWGMTSVVVFLFFAEWTLNWLHGALDLLGKNNPGPHLKTLIFLGGIPLLSAAIIAFLGRKHSRLQVPVAFFAGLAAPLFFIGIELVTYEWLSGKGPSFPIFSDIPRPYMMLAVWFVSLILVLIPVDVNFTSLHRHYKRKLSKVFLIQPKSSTDDSSLESGADIKLSACQNQHRSPYPLINAALNVPASKNAAMQGRLTDFFLFSPEYCGSPITGYHRTTEWERADPKLSLGTAVATSAAAASPLMGLATQKHLRFWLALLNLRLGYWLKKPARTRGYSWPSVTFFLREMFGRLDEKSPFLNITDGGHIENLGVYELLRRRCRFIVAVDGEHDPLMNFNALTTLQRLASIDLGITLDINLEDLRLRNNGLSRSHFEICRIQYPEDGEYQAGTGYLIYLKLSITGNEGEFIGGYRQSEPDFPHHSTLNQFFTEAQFEAYRSLGEHVGDKLFMSAIVGNTMTTGDESIDRWFEATADSMLSTGAYRQT